MEEVNVNWIVDVGGIEEFFSVSFSDQISVEGFRSRSRAVFDGKVWKLIDHSNLTEKHPLHTVLGRVSCSSHFPEILENLWCRWREKYESSSSVEERLRKYSEFLEAVTREESKISV